MIARHLIVIGGSAGGVEALLNLAPQLPGDLAAAVCVVIHFPPESPSLLPQLLQRKTALNVHLASNGMELEAGHAYVAPPDWHLLIDDHACLLSHGPREHAFRPSIDVLFRSAAESFRHNVIGVVLSGSLDDGSAGLRRIKLLGGKCIVQDPEDATFPAMPTNAMKNVQVDRSVPVRDMGASLIEMMTEIEKAETLTQSSDRIATPGDDGDLLQQSLISPPEPESELERSVDTLRLVMRCPECGGVLQETREESIPEFRCRVGHSFSLLSLLEAQGMALEQELWSTFNGLLERMDICRRLIESARQRHQHQLESEYVRRAEDARTAANLLRDLLLEGTLFREIPPGD